MCSCSWGSMSLWGGTLQHECIALMHSVVFLMLLMIITPFSSAPMRVQWDMGNANTAIVDIFVLRNKELEPLRHPCAHSNGTSSTVLQSAAPWRKYQYDRDVREHVTTHTGCSPQRRFHTAHGAWHRSWQTVDHLGASSAVRNKTMPPHA
jgi:hypothetical protein